MGRALLAGALYASLAYRDPETGAPGISRIALGLDKDGMPVTLISALAQHFSALRADPACALLVGEPGPKGDPLTHPRLMITAAARFVDRNTADHAALRGLWLTTHPKARLYVDFADFAFVRFGLHAALLNGGFGKAFRFGAADLRAAPQD
ncbi:MAG: pyridoxamine 5'-phosphate oxidase family protein [Paracoccaceae bacterium]|nr:pyridoxamine 5'-phosphate oxidase family protein [Paracoccaceae bacterium]